MLMKFGIIGSGSWGTALAKIISDNGQKINWWIRSNDTIEQFIEKSTTPNIFLAQPLNLKTFLSAATLFK